MEKEEPVGPSWSGSVTLIEAGHAGCRRCQQLVIVLEFGPFGTLVTGDDDGRCQGGEPVE